MIYFLHARFTHLAHLHNQCSLPYVLEVPVVSWITCAAVESQLGGGVKFLDEELGQRYSVVRVQGFVAFLPVQHQVIICVCIWRGETKKK